MFPCYSASLTEQKYLSEAGEQIESIRRSTEAIVVIGGGTVGIEMASELKGIHPTKTLKLIQSRDKLLSSEPLPDDFKDQTLSLLEEAGVEVTRNNRVTDVTAVKYAEGSSVYKVTLSDGIQSMASHVIWAISKSIPRADYLRVAALNNEGLPRLIRDLILLETSLIPSTISPLGISWPGQGLSAVVRQWQWVTTPPSTSTNRCSNRSLATRRGLWSFLRFHL